MCNKSKLIKTPFTDTLLTKKSLSLTSYHALPINQLKSLENSALLPKYIDLLGNSYTNSEVTYTDSLIDSPVIPKKVLKESQQLTAEAFGAKETLYVTTGTTTSNYIAVLGSAECNDRVLVDRNCHQSMHFATKINKNRVDYSTNILDCQDSGRIALDIKDFLDKYETALKNNDPYKLVIISSSSYEGVIYKLEPIIEQCLRINDKVTFLIDEAWFSFGYFHDYYKEFSAMNIANRLAAKYPDYNVNIVSTQSAHKSLSALRQGSYIHVNGSSELIKSIRSYKYMLHTTSPNYPILASLELSRAQMVLEGTNLIETLLRESSRVLEELSKCNNIYLNKCEDNEGFFIDPTKISVNLSKKKIDINIIESYLLSKGIYISRKTSTSILFNLHIGISKKDVDHLINTLKEIDNKVFKSEVSNSLKEINKKVFNNDVNETIKEIENKDYKDDFGDDKSDYYLISYPPGIPIKLPGDKIEGSIYRELKELRDSGVKLIKIYN